MDFLSHNNEFKEYGFNLSAVGSTRRVLPRSGLIIFRESREETGRSVRNLFL